MNDFGCFLFEDLSRSSSAAGTNQDKTLNIISLILKQNFTLCSIILILIIPFWKITTLLSYFICIVLTLFWYYEIILVITKFIFALSIFFLRLLPSYFYFSLVLLWLYSCVMKTIFILIILKLYYYNFNLIIQIVLHS